MATNPDEAAAAVTAAKSSDVKVRILLTHGEYQPNWVVPLSKKDAASAVAAGWADDDADAVAYAEANEPQPEAQA